MTDSRNTEVLWKIDLYVTDKPQQQWVLCRVRRKEKQLVGTDRKQWGRFIDARPPRELPNEQSEAIGVGFLLTIFLVSPDAG